MKVSIGFDEFIFEEDTAPYVIKVFLACKVCSEKLKRYPHLFSC